MLVSSALNQPETTAGVMVDAGDLLGCDGGIPGTWQKSGNDIELLGGVKESLGERHGFVLVFVLHFSGWLDY
jgi:hypothetical protein